MSKVKNTVAGLGLTGVAALGYFYETYEPEPPAEVKSLYSTSTERPTYLYLNGRKIKSLNCRVVSGGHLSCKYTR